MRRSAECVISLLRDGRRRQQLGQGAIDHVGEHCTWRDMAGRLDALLEQGRNVGMGYSSHSTFGP